MEMGTAGAGNKDTCNTDRAVVALSTVLKVANTYPKKAPFFLLVAKVAACESFHAKMGQAHGQMNRKRASHQIRGMKRNPCSQTVHMHHHQTLTFVESGY